MKSYSIIIFCSLILFVNCSQLPPTEKGFHAYLDEMYGETVPLIHADNLPDSIYSSYVFLDTRAKKEYETSHLPEAEWVGYTRFQKQKLASIPKDQPIVVYCSVGYRSERIGKELQKMGFREVYNLYGGIFEWNNKGYLMHNEYGNPTDSIHTYNQRWGRWVFRGNKIY